MAENVMAKIPQALYNFIDELESWHPEVFAKHKLTAKSMKADTALMENLYYRHRRFMETTNYDADYAIKLALASVCNIPITDWFTIDKEFEYLKQFTIEANDYDVNNTTRQQIRALWTAYCLHKNLEPDTGAYDMRVFELYEFIVANDPKVNFESFDLSMGEFLC